MNLPARRTPFGFLAVCLVAELAAGCGEPLPDAKQPLRVTLFPYLPDAAQDQRAGMLQRLKTEFEAAHPDVELVLNPPCFKGDVYDAGDISGLLGGSNPSCQSDVAEIDTIFLGEVADAGVLEPWPALPAGITWHPAAVKATTYNQLQYGVPHWLCGEFILSRDAAVGQADTLDRLLMALAARGTPEPDLVGNLLGSWNLPSIYLDAWASTYRPEDVAQALSDSIDRPVADSLKRLAAGCKTGATNPCIDGTYDMAEDEDLPYLQLAQGKADSAIGYSENLHPILRTIGIGRRQELHVSYAPLGPGKRPLLFTDAFLLSKRCTDRCQDAATRFVRYMGQTSTYAWIVGSEDAPADRRVPRYLLPAAMDAYSHPVLKQDPLYQSLSAEIQGAQPYPNKGLYGIRKKMRDSILAYISAP